MKDWLLGIPYETAYWEALYSNNKAFSSLMGYSRLGKEISLDGFDVKAFLLSQTEKCKILDVGAGMSFLPGNYIYVAGKKEELDIHYIDPLAGYYNRIAQRTHRDVPEVEFGMMDFLSAFFPNKDISLVIIQNALDHSAIPTKGIIEALNVLKTGGVLYLNHHPNEAEYENYRGFHKFNIDIVDGVLTIWNQTKRYNINELIKDFASIQTSFADKNPVAVITKTKDVPPDLTDKCDDIRVLGRSLIQYSEELGSAGGMICYHCRYLCYRVIQRLSKLFSVKTRQKIKKLVS